ncbi:MAG TPA: helix-turn-helix transcriptional regulator [Caulobacterales bacterium]|nr:helix-turn-helix transcriptional regulator [Caulobacterales bacterium]
MQHAQIWRAIDALAARRGLTASGLARAAGLDPTTFNRSKRMGADGKARWPSTESLSRALQAAGAGFDEFAALLMGRGSEAGRSIPIVGLARAGAHGFFDDAGFPVGAEETVHFPGLGEERVYALEINGDSMLPVYRAGDVVVVQPGAPVRRGDRIVLRTVEGEVMAKQLGRRNDQVVELISLNPAYPTRTIKAADVEWIGRIVWASQ